MIFTLPNDLTLELQPCLEIALTNDYTYHTIKFLDTTALLLVHYCPSLAPLDEVIVKTGGVDLATFVENATFRLSDAGEHKLYKFILACPASEVSLKQYYARKSARLYK